MSNQRRFALIGRGFGSDSFNQAVADYVGSILVDTPEIDFTYDMTGPTISATVGPNVALLDRDPQEFVGANLFGVTFTEADTIWGVGTIAFHTEITGFGEGGPGRIVSVRVNGSLSSPTAVLSGQNIFVWQGGGMGTTTAEVGLEIRGVTTEAWTDSARGARMSFNTIANGSTTLVERLRIATDGIQVVDGAVGTPSFTFLADTDTGWYRITTNVIGLTTAGTERLRVNGSGAWGLSGANYGSAGEVLTSNGSGSPPTWEAATGGGGFETTVRGGSWVKSSGAIATPVNDIDIYIAEDLDLVEVVILTEGGTGSCVVDIWKDTYTNFPPTDADSITGGNEPEISSGVKSSMTTFTSWTDTSFVAGDILRLHLDSSSTFTRISVYLVFSKP